MVRLCGDPTRGPETGLWEVTGERLRCGRYACRRILPSQAAVANKQLARSNRYQLRVSPERMTISVQTVHASGALVD
jgi:hypothetical protein